MNRFKNDECLKPSSKMMNNPVHHKWSWKKALTNFRWSCLWLHRHGRSVNSCCRSWVRTYFIDSQLFACRRFASVSSGLHGDRQSFNEEIISQRGQDYAPFLINLFKFIKQKQLSGWGTPEGPEKKWWMKYSGYRDGLYPTLHLAKAAHLENGFGPLPSYYLILLWVSGWRAV